MDRGVKWRASEDSHPSAAPQMPALQSVATVALIAIWYGATAASSTSAKRALAAAASSALASHASGEAALALAAAALTILQLFMTFVVAAVVMGGRLGQWKEPNSLTSRSTVALALLHAGANAATTAALAVADAATVHALKAMEPVFAMALGHHDEIGSTLWWQLASVALVVAGGASAGGSVDPSAFTTQTGAAGVILASASNLLFRSVMCTGRRTATRSRRRSLHPRNCAHAAGVTSKSRRPSPSNRKCRRRRYLRCSRLPRPSSYLS